MWEAISSGRVWQSEICNRAKDGSLYWVDSTIVPLMDEQGGSPVGYASIRFDVTELHRLVAAMAHQAQHDPLTKLANRTLLFEHFELAVANAAETGKAVGICLLDLEKFKQINDKLGHGVGDRLLEMVAKRLSSSIREDDLAARIGGDEFVLLISEVSNMDEARTIFERTLAKLALPYRIGEHTLEVTSSGGASFFPSDASSLDELLNHSDRALYQAKAAGRSCLRFFVNDLAA